MFLNLTIKKFSTISDVLLAVSCLFGSVFMLLGLYFGLYASPADYQQGEIVRIMYIHVPSAWMALGIYTSMTIASIMYLIWKMPLASIIAENSAPIGTVFALSTLLTGSIWGKPIWGTWWVWDARLTSMLILFFIYLGYIMLSNSYKNTDKGRLSLAILCIFGFINIPIIKFSVDFWNSLHQPASILRMGAPTIHSSMLYPLIYMILGFLFYFIMILIIRIKTNLIKMKINKLEMKFLK